jgi:predicted dehydrogenase
MHLDLYGRPHEKFIRFVGSEGTLLWSADPNEISISRTATHDWQTQTYNCERNDMFVGVAKEFLDLIGGAAVTTCKVEDGVNVLKVIEAARKSSADDCTVTIAG